jgi:DNA-binding transcriptional LysR family regulator
MPNLLEETSGLMAFVRTVEAGSFTAAARDLSTTPSAVSKSVARLEQKVGARLFLRSTRTLTLTQDGQVFFERVAPLLRELDFSDDVIRSEDKPSGRLRVSMPGELATLLLPTLFDRFAKAYPGLRLEIGVTDRYVNLVREDYDVALRVGTTMQEDLIVRRLADLPMTIVASAAFRDEWSIAGSIGNIADVPFARYTMGTAVQPVRLADGTTFIPKGRINCDTGMALIHAALSGLGAAYLLRCLVEEELKTGSLVEFVPELAFPKLPLSVLHAFGRTVPTRVRLFSDFMAAEAKALA